MPNSYLPILDLRPAEMLALEELPAKDKDTISPLFRLRPWVGSNHLDKSIGRLKKAFGNRPCFLEVAEKEFVEREREVHTQLGELRSSADGYQRWVEFLSEPEHAHFIPALQLGGELALFYQQIEKIYAMGRGFLVRLEGPKPETITALCDAIAGRTNLGLGVTFILDFGKQNASFSNMEPYIKSLVSVARAKCPSANIALSASSFPEAFTSIEQQKIYERLLFNNLSKELENPIIYSDRGSTRAEKQHGGGGLPAPRIDYPKKNEWFFFRQSTPSTTAFDGYQTQALNVMRSEIWDKGLKLWGSQMIERTAAGDSQAGISSPNRSTAVRINLHLHRQIHYLDDKSFFDTDEEWTD